MLWESLDPAGFPDYFINEHGHIRSYDGYPVNVTYNQAGFPYVQIREEDGSRKVRSVMSLVARIFLDEPERDIDDTLIRKDGDKNNTHASNLAWRTRSYAITYHRALKGEGIFNFPVYALENDGERHIRFETMRQAAIHYGVLEQELFNNMTSESEVYYAPHVQMYKN